jgi:hypothetical protein
MEKGDLMIDPWIELYLVLVVAAWIIWLDHRITKLEKV